MEHVAAFLLLIACPGDAQTCHEVPAPQVAYETVQDCEIDLGLRIRMQDEAPSQLRGKCVAVDPANFETDMLITWDVSNSGQLLVEVETEDLPGESAPMVAQLGSNGPTYR